MKHRGFVYAMAMLLPMAAFTGCGSNDEPAYSMTADGGAKKGIRGETNGAVAEYSAADAAEGGAEAEDGVREEALVDDAYYSDGEAAEDMPAGAEYAVGEGEEYPVEEPIEEPEPEPVPDTSSAFVLTAGEWNDNDNWGFFSNVVNKQLISFPAFGLDPLGRVAVTVESGGTPVANQEVTLLSADGATLWTAQTDKNGKAYLFYDSHSGAENVSVRAADTEQPVELPKLSDGDEQTEGNTVSDAAVTLELPSDTSQKYSDTEVMFILDTTGSMGDEILYLQKDFASIAEEVAGQNITFSMNFYRDEGDSYVTKCNPFTADVDTVRQLLNAESADGGGDLPEAVAQILEDTVTNGQWRSDTNKIAFLIFDAPPHAGAKYEQQVYTAVESAAARGIHIVPVVASNADRETELFGRAAAIMTNSNYVFLTDDSGVGESHMEPIIGDYDVELLHDIIVRNINEVAS